MLASFAAFSAGSAGAQEPETLLPSQERASLTGTKARYCARLNQKRFVALKIKRNLGCSTMRRLVGFTMKNGGYFQNKKFYCRWGGGSAQFPSKKINGRIYFAGFCSNKRTGREASFFARRT